MINGYDVSKIMVYTSANVYVETFTFPVANASGRKEVLQDDIIYRRYLGTGEINQYFLGTHVVWEIPFDEWATKAVCQMMYSLRKYRSTNLGYKFILYPHNDLPQRSFEVLLYDEKIELGLRPATSTGMNNELMFGFISRYYVDENWMDKDLIEIIPMGNFFTIIT
jgi:hypothetical protein